MTTHALDARQHLAWALARTRLQIQRYMRRYADRLVRNDDTYSDFCVSDHELRRVLGRPPVPGAEVWLDRAGLPTLAELDEALVRQRAELERALGDCASGVWLPLEELRASFSFGELAMDLLVAAAAPSLSVDMSRLYAVAWSDFSLRQPTVGFLADVIAQDDAGRDAALALLSPQRPLIAYRLLHLQDNPLWRAAPPLLHALVGVPQEVLDFISGGHAELAAGCRLHEPVLDERHLVLAAGVAERVREALRPARARLHLAGLPGTGRRSLVAALAAQMGTTLMEIDLIEALAGGPPLPRLAELLRSARLRRATLLLRVGGLSQHPLAQALRDARAAVWALMEGYPDRIVFTAPESDDSPRLLVPDIAPLLVPLPDAAGQRALWQRTLQGALPEEQTGPIAAHLSATYRLPPGAIHRAFERWRASTSPRARRQGAEHHLPALLRAVRHHFDHQLGWLADTVPAELTLDDVVLPDDLRAQLHEILSFARHADRVFSDWGFGARAPNGRGLSVLLSGPPGTGKTLVASVLAYELSRVLYRVDLSRIVDKYIGETEKNLNRVFEEAERAQAVLLFDEADSLFARRTQVKSSNDRYANLEVNYLLQRLDDYSGVSVLTTNFVTSLDEAFQRRIRFKLTFPTPDAAQRAELWRRLVPDAAPRAHRIDWAALGDAFAFTGGHIRNAVLRALIHAAALGVPLNDDLLYDAALAESREMGTLVRNEGE